MGLFPSRSIFPRLILFDVEGTLIYSRHPRFQPLLDSLELQFGSLQVTDSLLTDDNTDVSICRQILEKNSIELNDDTYEKVQSAIRDQPRIIRDGVNEGKYEFDMVENTEFVLKSLAVRSEIRLGLLSTCSMPVTGIKLDSAGHNTAIFEGRFRRGVVKPIGAFGGDADTKYDLIPIAVNQYCTWLNEDLSRIAPHDVMIVGNHKSDVDAAHQSGVPCVAVGTTEKLITLANADWVLSDFLDLGSSVAKIIATEIKEENTKRFSSEDSTLLSGPPDKEAKQA